MKNKQRRSSVAAVTFRDFGAFLFAFIVPFLYKRVKQVHTGWFVLIVPVVLFVYFISKLPVTMAGETVRYAAEWIPSSVLTIPFILTDSGCYSLY